MKDLSEKIKEQSMGKLEVTSLHGTPYYLYDIKTLKQRIDMMREHQTDIGLCYAMKAAPVLAGYVAPFVDRLEVCSPGEYEICIRDGVAPDKIMVSGVLKTRESMSRILSLGGAAGYFTIESPEHYNILEDVSKKYFQTTNYSQTYYSTTEKTYNEQASDNQKNTQELNSSEITNNVPKLRCFIRLTSGNQFGVDKTTLEDLINKISESQYLELIGIHYFSGTQKNLKKIEHELTDLAAYGAELKEKYNREFSLEYGPGLGIDYFIPKDCDWNNAETRISFLQNIHRFNESDMTGLMELVEKTGIRKCFSDITFEYGRYIAAPCGEYHTCVADVKTNDGTNYAILDGGIHQITFYGSMVGMKIPYITHSSLHKLLSDEPATNIITKNTFTSKEASENEFIENESAEYESSAQMEYCLAGALCSINDILVRKISLPKLDIGDTLCFNLAGAYCATEGISLFLSRDLPAIIVRDQNGEEKKIRNHFETNTLNGGYDG